MRHLIILHIHSCFASFSSGDRWVSREVPSDHIEIGWTATNVEAFNRLSSDNQRYFDEAVACYTEPGREPLFIREIVHLPGWVVYYTADPTEYHRGLHGRDLFGDRVDLTEKVAALVTAGWSEEEPAEYVVVRDAERAREKAESIARRTAEGYVFPDTDVSQPRTAFQGGLSDELFNHPVVSAYLIEKTDLTTGGVCCWGYIGNSNRRVELDKALETHLRERVGWTVQQIADWLCSRAGRHFADSYESVDDLNRRFKTVEEQDAEATALNARYAGRTA